MVGYSKAAYKSDLDGEERPLGIPGIPLIEPGQQLKVAGAKVRGIEFSCVHAQASDDSLMCTYIP